MAVPTSYTLGKHFENFVQGQLASGRYNNASEVMRDALRLMEERERRLAALDSAVERGMADVEAGRVSGLDAVSERLAAKYTLMGDERNRA
jgi:antitoxin ParD1/3/4